MIRVVPLCLLFAALLPRPAAAAQNVLVIVADDLGVDRVAAYGEHPDPGHTPRLDQLASEGVLFRNCWSNPVCTTTRASILSGRYALRTGVGGGPPTYLDPPWLKNEEVTIAEALPPTYAKWALGKWHLDNDVEPFLNPLDQGFDLHWGSTGSLQQTLGETYFDWIKSVDGTFHETTKYATTDTIDDALTLIGGDSGPWFLYLALNAPHGPVHKPPPELHTFTLPTDVGSNIPIHTKAMIEAMDTELGRLFDSIAPAVLADTLVIFVGDNGTSKVATTAPFVPEHAKGTIFEGGINVPLIIAGPGVVQGAVCDALVDTTDIFATVADFVGVPHATAIDSVSMLPYLAQPALPSIRPWAYAEYFAPDGFELHPVWDRALRDGRYKLVQRFLQDKIPFEPRFVEFYDLLADPFELDDLTKHAHLSASEQASFDTLSQAATTLVWSWLDFGQALAGTHGEPLLKGGGFFDPGGTFSVTLSGALESATTVVVLGFGTFDLPFKGGIMVPDFTPPGALLLASTDPAGQIVLASSLPVDAPSGLHVYIQDWIQDPLGPAGWSASNAIAGTVQ
ncbi:MAG: sulfatase-like hydrolase/transferase [Planctomycetes bacterium]|nr:sulfatase-like hydrolase/transferase [Planctomycetota bacterium]